MISTVVVVVVVVVVGVVVGVGESSWVVFDCYAQDAAQMMRRCSVVIRRAKSKMRSSE